VTRRTAREKDDKRARKRQDYILQECKIRKTKGHYSIYIHTKKLGKLFSGARKMIIINGCLKQP
jgi:hypothetical protein